MAYGDDDPVGVPIIPRISDIQARLESQYERDMREKFPALYGTSSGPIPGFSRLRRRSQKKDRPAKGGRGRMRNPRRLGLQHPLAVELGAALALRRKALGHTQQWLGDQIGALARGRAWAHNTANVRAETVDDWERGIMAPSRRRLLLACEAMHITHEASRRLVSMHAALQQASPLPDELLQANQHSPQGQATIDALRRQVKVQWAREAKAWRAGQPESTGLARLAEIEERLPDNVTR